MANVCYWIQQVGVLLSLFTLITAQQPGFLNINCGGTMNHTAEHNITWVTDASYIDVGETAAIGDFYSLRYFPKPLKKSCYHLPVPSNVPYLSRLWFLIGNYQGYQSWPLSFAYSFETTDMLVMDNITLSSSTDGTYKEGIFVTSDTAMYVCLIRTFESDDPFISGIELRTLQHGMYPQAKPGTGLNLNYRIDVGGNSTVRYPHDKFDRIWTADITLDSTYLNFYESVTSEVSISTNNTEDLPPTAVMQTAWVINSSTAFPDTPVQGNQLLLLYFAEVQKLNKSEYRSFDITINGGTVFKTITLPRNYSAVEQIFVFVCNGSNGSNLFSLWNLPNSPYPPLINAYEYYALFYKQQPTYPQDTQALEAIKRSFNLKDWVSDPCYVIPWKGIGCDNSSSAIRISEIDLSGGNLTGSLPKEIQQLTALVKVSLNNNNLTGPLPDLSYLTLLQTLYLQNNNLNGPVPEWLSRLQNLQELNIENNSFSGVIPAQLLHNCSLKFNYSGNPYLRMDKIECFAHNSNKNKLKVIVGTTLSGILIIALALMAGIAVYRNKCRRKKQGASKRTNGSLSCTDFTKHY